MSKEIILFFLLIGNLIITFNLKKISKKFNIYDFPDCIRKSHITPTPLLGGIIFLFSIIVLLLLYFFSTENIFFELLSINKKEFLNLFILLLFVFLIGIFDDKIGISANKKLFLLSFVIFIYLKVEPNLVIYNLNFSSFKYSINLGVYSVLFTTFCFLLFINAFNMFDGIDLQCGLYSLFIIIILFILNQYLFIYLYLIIQIIFFLILNFKKKIFMGDSGTLFLSTLFSFFIIKTYKNENYFFADDIFLLMLIPGIDLLRLAIFRILKKKHPFKADREHIHHYLLSKFSLINTIIIIQLLIIIPTLVGIYFRISSMMIVLSLIIYFFLIIKFRYKN
jgi:UDP-GlcNAc:undecaprenyl-phosphate/decaprenyl-phosphate GlcNAc-1-phosphate transferase